MSVSAILLPSQVIAPLGAAALLSALVGAAQITLRARSGAGRGATVSGQAAALDNQSMGGVAIVSAVALVLAALSVLAPEDGQRSFVLVLLLSALPVLIPGVLRDIGRPWPLRAERMAALLSAVLACAGLGVWVPRLDLLGIDALMSFAPLAILLTVLVAASFVRAARMLDGRTMSAALTAMFSALGLALMAYQAGLATLVPVAAVAAGALGGLLLLNLGKRRLLPGQTGALGIAHLLVWLSVSVMALVPDAAFGAVLLILFWPVADVVQQALHRVLPGRRDGLSPKLLLHRRVRNLVGQARVCTGRPALCDALATLIMLPLTAAPVVAGVMLWDSPAMAYLALCLFAVVFEAVEPVLVRLSAGGAQPEGLGGLQAMAEADPDPGGTVVSPLSGMFIEDGHSLNVEIFRLRDSDQWLIETDDGENLPVRWQQSFPSDEDAWEAFLATVRHETMDALSGRYQVRNR